MRRKRRISTNMSGSASRKYSPLCVAQVLSKVASSWLSASVVRVVKNCFSPTRSTIRLSKTGAGLPLVAAAFMDDVVASLSYEVACANDGGTSSSSPVEDSWPVIEAGLPDTARNGNLARPAGAEGVSSSRVDSVLAAVVLL